MLATKNKRFVQKMEKDLTHWRLSVDLSLEEFAKGLHSMEVYGVTKAKRLRCYLAAHEYDRIYNEATRKPTRPKEETLKIMEKRISADLFDINKVNGYFVTAPELFTRDVLELLEKEVVNKWYERYGHQVKKSKLDPKGIERIGRIEKAYWDTIQEDRQNIIGNGYMKRNGGTLILSHSSKEEVILLSLVNERKLYVKTADAGKQAYGGSVSGTTLKELKQHLLTFANNSNNKEYWKAIHKLVSENI